MSRNMNIQEALRDEKEKKYRDVLKEISPEVNKLVEDFEQDILSFEGAENMTPEERIVLHKRAARSRQKLLKEAIKYECSNVLNELVQENPFILGVTDVVVEFGGEKDNK